MKARKTTAHAGRERGLRRPYSERFGLVWTNSGAFSPLVGFVWAGVKAVNENPVQTKHSDWDSLKTGWLMVSPSVGDQTPNPEISDPLYLPSHSRPRPRPTYLLVTPENVNKRTGSSKVMHHLLSVTRIWFSHASLFFPCRTLLTLTINNDQAMTWNRNFTCRILTVTYKLRI